MAIINIPEIIGYIFIPLILAMVACIKASKGKKYKGWIIIALDISICASLGALAQCILSGTSFIPVFIKIVLLAIINVIGFVICSSKSKKQ